MGKDTRLQFRISEEKKKRFDECAKLVGLNATALGEAAVDALCDYIEENEEITLPLVVLPKSAIEGKTPGNRATQLPGQVAPDVRTGSRSSASRPTPANSLNEDQPVALKPVKPSREPASKPVTHTRAALRKMVEKETKKSV
ncbi:MAG: hypothetical protein P4L99_27905 [Chthoniobacter sp.]|nr:hypothetical protein [Chthoniobacter sp.]